MSREQIMRLAREQCLSRNCSPRGLVSIDLGAGWLIVRHTHGEWLVVIL